MSARIKIDVYSRPACHLCDDAKAVLERSQKRFPIDIRVINVESDPALENAYGAELPVIVINGVTAFKYRVDPAELERKLRQAWTT